MTAQSSNGTNAVLIVGSPITKIGGTIRRLVLWSTYLTSTCEVYLKYWSATPQSIEKTINFPNKKSNRVNIIYSKSLGRIQRATIVLSVLSTMRTIIKTNPYYIIGMFPWSGLATGIAVKILRFTRLTNTKYGLHIAGDLVPPELHKTLKTMMYRIIAKWNIFLADEIIAISPGVLRSIHNKYSIPSDKPCHIVPISIAPAPYNKKWPNNHSKINFGVASRLTPDKGIHHAIEAIARLHAGGIHANLDIFGDGSSLSFLKSLAKQYEIDAQINFHGWAPNPLEKMKYIDCLILPSMTEGTPRCILEAASMGIPAIATDVGGVSDIIDHGHSGWLVPHGHPLKLTAIMRQLAENPSLLSNAGMIAQKKVLREHAINLEIEGLSRIFRKGKIQ